MVSTIRVGVGSEVSAEVDCGSHVREGFIAVDVNEGIWTEKKSLGDGGSRTG